MLKYGDNSGASDVRDLTADTRTGAKEMYRSFTIKNFRCFDELTVEGMGRINLIAGKNNVGKTALLEALWLLSGPDLPGSSQRIDSFRGLPWAGLDAAFYDIFLDNDPQNRVKITAQGDWETNTLRKLEIYLSQRSRTYSTTSGGLESSAIQQMTRTQDESEHEIVFDYLHDDGKKYTSRAWCTHHQPMQPAPGVPIGREGIVQERDRIHNISYAAFMPALYRRDLYVTATMFSAIQLRGEDDKVLRLIRPLEPRLNRLTIISIDNVPVIHAYLNGMKRPMPIQLLGEGLNRVLALALSMSEATGSLLLIDEIENGLHHRVHSAVFPTLLKLAKELDVQIFATTHSSECIRTAYNSFEEEDKAEFAFYRLSRVNEDVKAVYFDNEMMETSIEFRMRLGECQTIR